MVRLEPLAENDAAALLERALRARLVDEQTGRRALEAAQGNPLFLEQLLAIHAEHGEQLDVPPTVHAVLPPASTAFRPPSGSATSVWRHTPSSSSSSSGSRSTPRRRSSRHASWASGYR
jgi:hypothetical protein